MLELIPATHERYRSYRFADQDSCSHEAAALRSTALPEQERSSWDCPSLITQRWTPAREFAHIIGCRPSPGGTMPDETVVVLGAGATKACGGPLTNEILPWAFEHQNEIEREGYLDLVRRFIVDLFEVDPAANPKPSARLPSLTLLLSLIDIALDRRESLSPRWPDAMPLGLGDDLARVRHAFDYVIFAVLEQHLLRITDNPHVRLFKRLQESCGAVRVISLNYDIIAVNSIIRLAEETSGPGFADYCCQIATRFHIERPKIGTLLKLHGSLNWMYCPNCHRLELGVSGSGRYTAKVLDELYQVTIARSAAETLEERYSCHGSPCLGCGTFVRAVLISQPILSKRLPSPSHYRDLAGRRWRVARGEESALHRLQPARGRHSRAVPPEALSRASQESGGYRRRLRSCHAACDRASSRAALHLALRRRHRLAPGRVSSLA